MLLKLTTILGLDRLCDLLPESRVNPQQQKAIESHYLPFILQYGLPLPTIPCFNKVELNSELRRTVILRELTESQADTLILLGDLPIEWFLKYYVETKPTRLSQFGTTPDTYGRIHKMVIAGKAMDVIPLCHPRQAGKLGIASRQWGLLHVGWVSRLRNGGKLEVAKGSL